MRTIITLLVLGGIAYAGYKGYKYYQLRKKVGA